jgi:hypothetical protein
VGVGIRKCTTPQSVTPFLGKRGFGGGRGLEEIRGESEGGSAFNTSLYKFGIPPLSDDDLSDSHAEGRRGQKAGTHLFL